MNIFVVDLEYGDGIWTWRIVLEYEHEVYGQFMSIMMSYEYFCCGPGVW